MGLKLHVVCNAWGEIASLHITPANVDDRKPLKKLLKRIKGLVVGDTGYLSGELQKALLSQGIFLFTAARKNMKRVMTKGQHQLLKLRQIVESLSSVLKNRFHIARSLPRSVMGHIANYIYGILAYSLQSFISKALPLPKLP